METIIIQTNPIEKVSFNEAVLAIRQGQLVAFPTETVYGLGADALNPKAVSSIFAAKGRPGDNPLIIHIAEKAQIQPLVKSITPLAATLIDAFMPGPITLVFEKSHVVPMEVTAGLNTVAIRIPSHPIAHYFLECACIPVAAPSANISGKPSPTTARHVYSDLNGKIAFVIDGGACDYGVESTVVDVTGEIPVILRPGSITAEQILHQCGSVSGIGSQINQNGSYENALNQDTPDTPMSPGMKYRHYAPHARVILADSTGLENQIKKTRALVQEIVMRGEKAGVYACDEIVGAIKEESFIEVLTEINRKSDVNSLLYTISYGSFGDVRAASSGLFHAMREMDENAVSTIVAEALPVIGIGVAYMNRLLKAAGIKSTDKKNNNGITADTK